MTFMSINLSSFRNSILTRLSIAINPPFCGIRTATYLLAAFLFLGSCSPVAEAGPPPVPLAFGPDLIAVTADNTFARRYRTWGDFDAELGNYHQEAGVLAAQRGRPPLQSHVLAVFLKNVAVTSNVSLDPAGNHTACLLYTSRCV